MHQIQAALFALLPSNRKNTSGGWLSFNGVCCHHKGEKPDKRKRGGVLTSPQDGFQYNCFNCGFKAGWQPGKLFSSNTKLLFRWLGMSDLDIGKLGLLALKIRDDTPGAIKELNVVFKECQLPDHSKSLSEHISQGTDVTNMIQYLLDRGMEIDWYHWMWSPAAGYQDRVLIPFYQDGKIVGYTGRKITAGQPKYLTESQNGYVFNIDAQKYNRQYVVVVEGQFDAIAVDGVSIMTNEPNAAQVARINALGREVVCVPDRDRPGAKLLQHAVKHNWSVSLPPWGNNIKDVADAVKTYGRLYTLTAILHHKVAGEIKINLLKKKLERLDE